MIEWTIIPIGVGAVAYGAACFLSGTLLTYKFLQTNISKADRVREMVEREDVHEEQMDMYLNKYLVNEEWKQNTLKA